VSVELETRVRRANLVSRDRQLDALYGNDLSHRLLRDVYSKKEGRMSEVTDRPEPGAVTDVPADEKAFRPTPAPPKRRSPAFVPAILTAVIATGVIVALVARQPTPEVAQTPVQIGEAFMTALNAHDADGVLALMADDAIFPEDAEVDLRGELRIEELQGWTYDSEPCVETLSDENVARVVCAYSITNELTRVLGTGPYEGNSYSLVIENGEIISVSQTEPDTLLFEETFVPFFAWVVENRPEAGDMYWHYSDQANLAKWEQYLPEFVAAIEDAG
jgi:hypothetical protein